MPALIVVGLIGVLALALIYRALVFCARESGPAGKALAVALGAATTDVAIWAAFIFLPALAFTSCDGSCL